MDVSTVFGSELFEALSKAGVREETLKCLEEEEIIDFELLEMTSDELLRAMGIKGGQIIRLRKGVAAFKSEPSQAVKETPCPQIHSTPKSVAPPLIPPSPTTVPAQLPSMSLMEDEGSSARTIFPFDPMSCLTPERENSPSLSFESCKEERTAYRKNWISDFQLPTQFSPSVTNELASKALSTNRRNEFTRDICSSIRVYTMNPTRVEREHVSLLIIKKYPFLADSLGTGIGSWQEAIKNRFKNLRKNKRPATALPEARNKPVKKLLKKKLDNTVPDMPDGETNETCLEHISNMKKELLKTTNKNLNLVKQLMELTFAHRRQKVVFNPVTVQEMVNTYPALQLVSEMKAEFGRVVGQKDIVKEMTKKFKNSWQTKITTLAQKRNVGSDLFSEAEDIISTEPDKKSDIDESVAVLLLPTLLKDRSAPSDFIKICSAEEDIDKIISKTTAPRLVGSGGLENIIPLYLVSEGVIIAKLNNVGLPTALSLLVGIYYIFNMQYPPSGKNFFLFLEATLMNNTVEARKRVSVNKLLKDLA